MIVRSKVVKKITASFKTLLLSHRNPSHFACGIALLIESSWAKHVKTVQRQGHAGMKFPGDSAEPKNT